jgi:FHA domain-containing protein
MADGREAARRPLRQRSRRRWGIVGGVALCWLLADLVAKSAIAATVLLVAVGALGMASVAGLRAIGVNRDHPWVQRMASRPWRDGQDVLRVAMRHLPDVFVVTPSGSLLAPNIIEIQMNPDDLLSLREQMERDVIRASATEVYQEQVLARGARFAGPEQADVYVTPDESVPPGRYRLRQGVPVSAGSPQGAWYGSGTRQRPGVQQVPDAQFTLVSREYVPDGGQYGKEADGVVTVLEQVRPAIPVLRLVTGSSVAETVMSGARAGRGSVELVLPDVPTVSRQHAKFTFSDGRWRVTNVGRNGLCLNGAPVTGEQPVRDGDSIRWGARPDALMSRVEIGW